MQNTPQHPAQNPPHNPSHNLSVPSPDDVPMPKTGMKMGCGFLLWGLGVLGFALFLYFGAQGFDPDAAPTCGDDVMTPDHICWGSDGGTYEQMQADRIDNHEKQILIGNIGMAVGGVFILLAIAVVIRGVRRIRTWSGTQGPEETGRS